MKKMEQRGIGMAAVNNSLSSFRIERQFCKFLPALFGDFSGASYAYRATVQNLELLRVREQRLPHLFTSGILKDVRHSRVGIQRQTQRQIRCLDDENPFAEFAIIKSLARALNAAAMARGRRKG